MTIQASDRYTVLMVEDDPADVLLLGDVFAALSVPAVLECFQTGSRALQRLGHGPRPSLILLDHHLPDTSGPDLAERILGDDACGRPRIILFSEEPPLERSGPWEEWLVKPSSWLGWESLARMLMGRLLNRGHDQAASLPFAAH